MNMNKKVLIISGYGRAGRSVSRLLAEFGHCEITIAGRTLVKAQYRRTIS